MQVEFAILPVDIVVFAIAVIYAVFVLTMGDVLRRKLNLDAEFTRKIVHIFGGGAIWTVPFFPHPWLATFVGILFVLMTSMANTERFGRFFAAMARPEDVENASVRGPFWYAVSVTVLTALFTFTGNEAIFFLGAAGIHIMMFGDGMSAPIGMKYGKNHTVTILGSKRSLQGSLAFFVFGFIGSLFSFWYFGTLFTGYEAFVLGNAILWTEMFVLALVGATTATLVELVSPKGTDNITVPFITCAVMFLVGMALGVVVF